MPTFLIAIAVFIIASRFLIPLLIQFIANRVLAPTQKAPVAGAALGEKLLCIINFILMCLVVVLKNKDFITSVFVILFLAELGYGIACNKYKGGCYLWIFAGKDKSHMATKTGRVKTMQPGNHQQRHHDHYQDESYARPVLEEENLETRPDDGKASVAEQLLHGTNKYSEYLSTEDKIPARNIRGKAVYSVAEAKAMWINEDGILYYRKEGRIMGIRGQECTDNSIGIAVFCFTGEKDIEKIQAYAPKSTLSYFSGAVGEFEAGYFITQYGDTVVDYFITGQGFQHWYSYEEAGLYEKNGRYRLMLKVSGCHIVLLSGRQEGGNTLFLLLKELGPTLLAATREEPDYYVYAFTKEGRYITPDGALLTGSAKEEVYQAEGILRKAIKGVQKMTSREAIKMNETVTAPETGVSMDGVYNDGTFDLMCRFGEIRFAQAIAYKPYIQAIVAGKLVCKKAAVDVIDKIGDGWKDILMKDAALYFDNHLTHLIATESGGQWNIWLTDDESVWFILIVYLGITDTQGQLENQTRTRIQKMLSNVLNSFHMKPDTLLGYIDTIHPISYSRVIDTIDTQVYVQGYYSLNQATLAPGMFEVYSVKVMEDVPVVRQALIVRAPMDIKMTIRDVVKLRHTRNGEFNIYGVKAVLSHYEYEQLCQNSGTLVIDIEDNYSPAKLRDVYLEARELPLGDMIAIAGPYEGIYEFNFIVSNKQLTCTAFAQTALNTILSPYIHYRLNQYMVTDKYKIMMFKR